MMLRILPSKRGRLVLAALLTLPVVAYAVPALTLAGEVPPGTRVEGVDIGGLSPASAQAALDRELGSEAKRPLTVEVAGTTVRLMPQEWGLSLDSAATVTAALDGAGTPAGVFRSLFGSRDISPRMKVDDKRLDAGLTELARTVDRKPLEGRVRYRGLEPQAVLPSPGRHLDRKGAAHTVRQAYPSTGTIRLPVDRVEPAVSEKEVRRVADGIARTAVAAPLTLTNGEAKATVSGTQIAEHLTFVPDGKGGLRAAFDGTEIARELGGKLIGTGKRPKDATFRIVEGKPQVVASRAGQGIDADALNRAIAAALTGGGSRTIAVPLAETQPRLTTEKAGKLGVRQKVSSFTTRHPCCAPRVTNIHRIADIVDGYVVMPGETFSLNGVVGKRDKARGFVEAPMILNNRFVNDVGGGVSQFATTMFNAVFFGGFQDVQHTPHQYYISRYPAGRESTVSYPQPDFRWKNDSPYGVLIRTSYTGTSITVQFWSTKRFDIKSRSSERYNVRGFETLSESGPDCIPMPGAEGFSIDVWRVFKKDGEVLREQKFHTVYDPEPRLTCYS